MLERTFDLREKNTKGYVMKRVVLNMALLLASLTVCFVIGEITVRMLYSKVTNYNLEMWRYFAQFKHLLPEPNLPFVHRPDTEGNLYGVHVKTNSMGFRDREFSVEKAPSRKRILMLGDSFVFGWGVPLEKTMAKLVESDLSSVPGGIEVINMGVGNYNSTMEVELFKRQGLALNPDMVVLVYFVNDAEPIPRLSWLSYQVKRRSYFLALLFDWYVKVRPWFDKNYHWTDYYSSLYRPGAPSLEASRESIRELAALCKERGISLMLVSYPELHQVTNYPFNVATDYVQFLSNELGTPFLNLLPFFQYFDPESLWVSPEDTHGNVLASRVAAMAMTKAIKVHWGNLLGLPTSADSAGQSPETAKPAGVHLTNEDFDGELFRNESWTNPSCSPTMSGFRWLRSKRFPQRDLLTEVGFNFEHIYNGTLADEWRNRFSPRIDTCELQVHSETSASLQWQASDSSWPINCSVTYTLAGQGAIDIDVATSFERTDCFPLGYAGLMWASYVDCKTKRSIWFFGEEDQYDIGWMELGRDWDHAEMTVAPYAGTETLPYEKGIVRVNAEENPHYKFFLPLYFAYFDGDGSQETTDDRMAYAVMFNKAEPIRLQNCTFHVERTKTALDWQYVVRTPEVGKEYGYRARILYRPATSREDIVAEYVKWLKNMGPQTRALNVEAVPSQAGTIFPPDVTGSYPDGTEVSFVALSNDGWEFSHWEGEGLDKRPNVFASATLDQDTSVRAVFNPIDLSPSWQKEPAGWNVLFHDDFSQRSSSWILSDRWSPVEMDGRSVVEARTQAIAELMLLKPALGVSDVHWKSSVRIEDGSMTLSLIGSSAPGCHLRLARSTSLLLVGDFSNMEPVKRGRALPRGDWHDVEITTLGQELKVYFDGAAVISYSSPSPFNFQTVAIAAWVGSHVEVDDVLIEEAVWNGTAN